MKKLGDLLVKAMLYAPVLLLAWGLVYWLVTGHRPFT